MNLSTHNARSGGSGDQQHAVPGKPPRAGGGHEHAA
jgi:hypothetical protein